ncbi:MAG: AraC family transcriptional regulator [Elainellaceae cyanobacterium]
MALALSSAEYSELRDQNAVCRQSDPAIDECEMRYEMPDCLGRGYIRSVELSPGIWLDVVDFEYGHDLVLNTPIHAHLVQSSLWLNGLIHYADAYPTLGGNRTYLSGSGISPAYQARYGQFNHLVGVNIHLLPEVLEVFLSDMTSAQSNVSQLLLKQDDWKVSFFPDVTLPMQWIVQQILKAPFRGAARRLYLQAKVFELLALQLDPILNDQGQSQSFPGLKPDTIARIHHARQILTMQLEDPPSLLDLAQQVGVSDRTLRRGFQVLFGTTVWGYVTEQRLIQAEQLLRHASLTVAEVAHCCGYSNQGHFAAAFKRKFGITPKQCAMGKKSAIATPSI